MSKNKYIETPERMWELFTQYREWVENNPIKVQDYVGKDGTEVYREKNRPLTMEGFECFVMDNTDVTYPDLCHYFSGTNETYRSYFAICSRIKRDIRNNQIEGGMAGIFNPSITQRINNLVEKIQEDGKKEVTIRVKYDRIRDHITDTDGSPKESIEGKEEV